MPVSTLDRSSRLDVQCRNGFTAPNRCTPGTSTSTCKKQMTEVSVRIAFQVALLLGSICVIHVRAQISSFQHIVVIVQENRTPDNLFQGLCGPTYSLCPTPYDIQNFGTDSRGNKISLIQTPLGDTNDPDHSHQGFVRMCHLDTTTNQCRMDGLNSGQCDVDRCSFEFVDPADAGSYIAMAQQYGWANFMFQTNQGPSAIAHQFIFAGTSAPSASDDMAATFVAENITRLEPFTTLTPLKVRAFS